MQTYTFEYIVSGTADGTTLTPPLSDAVVQPDGVYRFEVENIGRIDPDILFLATKTATGDRFVKDIIISTPGPVTSSLLAVVAENLVARIADGFNAPAIPPVGYITYNRTKCVFVPQAGAISVDLTGVDGDPDPIVIRLSFFMPEGNEEYAELLGACCCEESSCVSPAITEFTPTEVDCADGTFTINGVNFDDNTLVSVFAACPDATAVVVSQRILSNTEIEVTLECFAPTTCPLIVTVSNGPGCSVEGQTTIGACVPPVIGFVTWNSSPDCLSLLGDPEDRVVTVTGSAFAPGATVEIFPTGTGSCLDVVLTLSDVNIVSDVILTFRVTYASGPLPTDCDFGIRVINSPGCQDELADAFCVVIGI